jgi:predicted nucleic acid-binding protein
MKPRIYIETSVIGYLAGRRSLDFLVLARQEWTDQFWVWANANCDLFTAELARIESSKGDASAVARRMFFLNQCPLIEETEEARQLAKQLIIAKAVPITEPEDALHIALATTAKMTHIASWNFSHLVGPEPKRKLEKVIASLGYEPPMLETPEAIYEGRL